MNFSRKRSMTQRGRQRSMLRFPSLLLATTALLMPCALQAQISFTSAVDLALRSDPKIKAAEASVEKARAALAYDARCVHSQRQRERRIRNLYRSSAWASLLSSVWRASPRSSTSPSATIPVRPRQGLQAALLAAEESRDQVAEDVAVTYLNLDNSQRRQAAMVAGVRITQRSSPRSFRIEWMPVTTRESNC